MRDRDQPLFVAATILIASILVDVLVRLSSVSQSGEIWLFRYQTLVTGFLGAAIIVWQVGRQARITREQAQSDRHDLQEEIVAAIYGPLVQIVSQAIGIRTAAQAVLQVPKSELEGAVQFFFRQYATSVDVMALKHWLPRLGVLGSQHMTIVQLSNSHAALEAEMREFKDADAGNVELIDFRHWMLMASEIAVSGQELIGTFVDKYPNLDLVRVNGREIAGRSWDVLEVIFGVGRPSPTRVRAE